MLRDQMKSIREDLLSGWVKPFDYVGDYESFSETTLKL